LGWRNHQFCGRADTGDLTAEYHRATDRPSGAGRLKRRISLPVVDGTPPYSFQWSQEGTTLVDDGHFTGANTPSLTISNVTTADAHYYSLLVTNASGGVTTTPVLLTVLVPPSISLNPISYSVPPGLPTIFHAAATGIPTPVYQWQLNGTNLPGAYFLRVTPNSAASTNTIGLYSAHSEQHCRDGHERGGAIDLGTGSSVSNT
jgi:hypothetical protein